MNKIEKIYFYFLLLIIIFFGIYLRFEDVKFWKKNKELFFYNNSPIYSEYDSYYFARLALDVKEGKFKPGAIDNYRFFPDNSSKAMLDEDNKFYIKYTISGNLLSIIWAYLSDWFNISLEKLTWYLIPILAVSVAIPVFFYLKDLGYPYAGLIGGVISVSAPMYLSRTNLMRLDHDVLNLALPIFIAYTFYKFFETSEKWKKYTWILISSFFLILYQLWYAHPNLNFVLIIMFLLRYFWDKKLNWKREDIIFLGLLILPQLWYVYIGPIHLYKQVKTLVFNIKSPTAAELLFKDFPNIFMSISELQKMSFWEVLSAVIFNKVLGVFGLIGVFLLFLFHFRKLLFLLPFFGIGLLSFFSGARFAMYLSPFIGMGLGYWIYLLFKDILPFFHILEEERKQKITVLLVGIVIFITTLIVQKEAKEALSLHSTPKVFSPLVKDMEWLKKSTPKDSVIWTWWDYGYAFQLYSRRATFHDGGSQESPKTYFIARSFATSDPKEAWLLTSFVSNYGLTGLAKLLKEGIPAKQIVEEIKSGKFCQPIKNPVYWVFTEDLIAKFGWIHYFGSYDFDKKEGIFGKIIAPTCKLLFNNLIQCDELNNAIIDLNNGLITVSNRTIPVKDFYYYDGKNLTKKKFFEQGLTVEIVKGRNNQTALFILEPPSDETLFNEMFLLRKYDPKYFELVLDDFPNMVVYKVKSEYLKYSK